LIVFGNLYLKNSMPRFNIIAFYQDGLLQEVEKDKKKELFPNVGQVFVPPNTFVPDNVKYSLYEIYESPTYEPDKPISHLYALGSEVKDVELYEIIQISGMVKNEQLFQRFHGGFHLSFEPLSKVLIHTEDDYLIGPLQLKKRRNGNIWEVDDASIVPYYQNSLDFLRYENTYIDEPERFFVVTEISKLTKYGYVDIASNERAIRDMLRIIRENVDVGDLSRKVIRQLSEWGNSNFFSEAHIKQRLKRVIHILQTHTLDEDLLQYLQKTIFDLPYVKSYVKSELESFQTKYQKKIEEENRELFAEVKQLKNELNHLKRELETKKKERERVEESIKQLQEKSVQKIAEIQSNVIDTFINQLTLRGLAFLETSVSLADTKQSLPIEPSLFSITLNLNAPIHNDLEEFWRGVDQQVRIPEFRLLAQTIICAVATNSPVVIIGKKSLELAQQITLSIAANETITVLPEVNTFSLNQLTEKFKHYRNGQAVKALVVHNAHLTTADFSLLPFLTLARWSGELMAPNLVVISIDETETAEEFLRKFQFVPIIDADSLVQKTGVRRGDRFEGSGQLLLTEIEGIKIEKDRELLEKFEEWLLEEHNSHLDPWSKQMEHWLYYLKISNVNQVLMFEWLWFMFNHYWQQKEPKM